MSGIKIILNVCYKYTYRKALVISRGAAKAQRLVTNRHSTESCQVVREDLTRGYNFYADIIARKVSAKAVNSAA